MAAGHATLRAMRRPEDRRNDTGSSTDAAWSGQATGGNDLTVRTCLSAGQPAEGAAPPAADGTAFGGAGPFAVGRPCANVPIILRVPSAQPVHHPHQFG